MHEHDGFKVDEPAPVSYTHLLCADEDPASAFARVAPYAYYVHAKDFIVKPFTDADPGEGSFRSRGGKYLRGTIVGHGNVPIKQCMYQLKRAGYDLSLIHISLH